MKRWAFCIGFLLASVTIAALAANAANQTWNVNAMGGRGHQGRYGRGWAHRNRLADLDLSQKQRDRIAEIRDTHLREMIQKRADLQTARLDLRNLMRDDHPNQRAIDDQIDRMAKIRADMEKSRVGTRLEVRSVLTDEQRAKLREPRTGETPDDRENDPRRP